MTKTTFAAFTRLIGMIAADVQEMKTIPEHLAALPERVRDKVRAEVLDCYGFAGSGYTDPDKYLEMTHWHFGLPHLDIVRDLQRWAAPRDPAWEDEDSDLVQHGPLYSRHIPDRRTTVADVIRGAIFV